MTWFLFLTLHFTVGILEPVYLYGTKPMTLERCNEAGKESAEWLTQDFVTVTWECREYDR